MKIHTQWYEYCANCGIRTTPTDLTNQAEAVFTCLECELSVIADMTDKSCQICSK